MTRIDIAKGRQLPIDACVWFIERGEVKIRAVQLDQKGEQLGKLRSWNCVIGVHREFVLGNELGLRKGVARAAKSDGVPLGFIDALKGGDDVRIELSAAVLADLVERSSVITAGPVTTIGSDRVKSVYYGEDAGADMYLIA